jgi:glutamate-ammonia-ligase adenylyltransferase
VVVSPITEEIERSPDPRAAALVLEQVAAAHPELSAELCRDERWRVNLIAVAAASPHLARRCIADARAVEVLADLDTRPDVRLVVGDPALDGAGLRLAEWKQLEQLRIAARDLTGLDRLEQVGDRLSDLATDVLEESWRIGGSPPLAIVGMGKLGAGELNYASDIDVVLVGEGNALPLLRVVRQSWKVDLDLRPEGRAGPLVRSLESYRAYWDRWAETWEFQALLKARAVAGNIELGAAFEREAGARVWARPFGAEELRQVRAAKARAEEIVARAGLTDREIKRGRGGIRDIEFAVQLLQLVHGRADASLRVRATLPALAALAEGDYVGTVDSDRLVDAYRFLRTVEHRLQMRDDQQVHTVPVDGDPGDHLARVLGFRDDSVTTARSAFNEELHRHQAAARSIHERLFFRPLLEAFSAGEPGRDTAMAPDAIAARLAAFGFSDADRTRQAVQELTRGLSRASRLMQQLLPLLLEWLSQSPDPDLGLLGLRALAGRGHSRDQLTVTCRESAEAARALCVLLGTGPGFARGFERHPDLIAELDRRPTAPGPGPAGDEGRGDEAGPGADLRDRARRSLAWRSGQRDQQEGLLHLHRSETLRIATADVLHDDTPERCGQALTELAEAVLDAAVTMVDPQVPFAVIAMGRLGGAELAYSSDLDVLPVFEPGGAQTPAEAAGAAEAAATALLRLVGGETPANRLYSFDTSLRPEGRDGPMARSVEAYEVYWERWAQPWERQALLRGRFVAGDPTVGRRFTSAASSWLWSEPFSSDDVRAIRRTKARVERERIPAGEDPQFHLKLGRGSLSDIEWTVQLLQLRHRVASTGTLRAIAALRAAGALSDEDAEVLVSAYRFCERTRNRLYLVRGYPGDSLPTTGHHLTVLARSLGTSPSELRDEYRRRTRRSRRVVERLFYGAAPAG